VLRAGEEGGLGSLLLLKVRASVRWAYPWSSDNHSLLSPLLPVGGNGSLLFLTLNAVFSLFGFAKHYPCHNVFSKYLN